MCIHANEHLRLASSGKPDLDINRGTVIQLLVMTPVMKRWIGPSPKNLTAYPHAALLRF
ncbi:hypothetical protein RK21_01103 [Pseudomonas plecoglossicida]|nr:hypothetical protein RK21_01103 [Pseudomonas plecoglossicida]